MPIAITDRIARGAVVVSTSAGTDTKGCANVRTDDRSAPCGATTYNTNQAEVLHLWTLDQWGPTPRIPAAMHAALKRVAGAAMRPTGDERVVGRQVG